MGALGQLFWNAGAPFRHDRVSVDVFAQPFPSQAPLGPPFFPPLAPQEPEKKIETALGPLLGASWARLGCQGRVRPGLAWNGKSDNGLKTWLAACMFELRRGILRHPSAPFGILRHPSGSFGVLRCPSVSLGILRYPSVFFGFLRYPSVFSVSFGTFRYPIPGRCPSKC